MIRHCPVCDQNFDDNSGKDEKIDAPCKDNCGDLVPVRLAIARKQSAGQPKKHWFEYLGFTGKLE